jgi:hypothetical protein
VVGGEKKRRGTCNEAGRGKPAKVGAEVADEGTVLLVLAPHQLPRADQRDDGRE